MNRTSQILPLKRAFFLLGALCALCLPARGQFTLDSVITNGLSDPRSIALFRDSVYIADSGNHRILRYAPDTGALTIIAGVTGRAGTNNGPGFVARFFSPKSIIPALGGLVVADSDNHALRFIDLSRSIPIVRDFAGVVGSAGFQSNAVSSNGVPALEGRFNTPIGIAADDGGNIYVADSKNNAIRLLTQIGGATQLLTIATNFLEPTAVAVGNQSGSQVDLFVADTRNHAIKLLRFDTATRLVITNQLSQNLAAPTIIAGSSARIAGTNDSLFADEALFNLPGALFWSGSSIGLIVSDTGNHTLRRIYQDPIFQDPIFQDPDILQFFERKDLTNRFSVETFAGKPLQRGLQNGPIQNVLFSSPGGLVRDAEGDLLIADSGNNALRRIQITPRLPAVKDPTIGWVDFAIDERTGDLRSVLVPINDTIFNNDLTIAILVEENALAFYNFGRTPGLFEPDTIAPPTQTNRLGAPRYVNGLRPDDVPGSIIDPAPDLTIKAISTAERRSPSGTVQARLRFQAAAPTITGDNPAFFTLRSATTNAAIYYTLDGSAPTNQAPPSILFPQIPVIPLPLTNTVTIRARAFKPNYKPSEITTKTFLPENFRPNQITFGFEAGEASSRFLGSAGQKFMSPVTLTLLPNQKIFSMQFNMSVSNLNGAAPLTPGAYSFRSMLIEQLNDGTSRRIDPKGFERFEIEVFTNIVPQGTLITTNFIPVFRDLVFVNSTEHLLGVGWLEIVGRTNLYNTVGQDLITFSQAHDRLFLSSSGKAVLGGYSFQIPAAASVGSGYRIKLGRPSAIENAFSHDVFIDTPTNGSFGLGPINAIKDVQVVQGGIGPGQLHYVVGDAAPFRWFNAGDFGDTNLLSSDVFQVFQAATYGSNIPPPDTDFLDAMDSCCTTAGGALFTNVFAGSNAEIDSILHGDNLLNITDVFVTFRRSLDPSLKWYARFWANGRREAAEVPNQFRGKLNTAPAAPAPPQANAPAESLASSSTEPPFALFHAEDARLTPGQLVRVPVRAVVSGPHPVRVVMLNLHVEPLEGSPALAEPVQFVPSPGLGKPAMTTSKGLANYAAAWLDEKAPGVSGSGELGALFFRVPSSATASAAYRIYFEHVSASPNGLFLMPQKTRHGLLLGAGRSASTYNDGIPDTWRLRHFGSIFNHLSHADADADGDGLSNRAEFNADTDPNDVRSQLRLLIHSASAGRTGRPDSLTLRWPSALNRLYVLEASTRLVGADWLPVAKNLLGTGREMQFTIRDLAEAAYYFRVRLLD